MSRFKALFTLPVLSAILSGCLFPPFGSSDEEYVPFDPEPVNLNMVQSTDIRLQIHTTFFEVEDSLEIVAKLRNSEFSPLLLGVDSSLELHVLNEAGLYQAVEVSELEVLDTGARFRVPSPNVPVNYKLILNRSNSEVIELFNIELNAKVSSESSARNVTYGNGEIFEFNWMSYDSNGRLDSVPPGWIRYRLDCGNPFVNRETAGSRVIYGSVDLSEDKGFDTAPTTFDVDTILSEHDITNFPCELYLERIFYVYMELDNYFLFSGSFSDLIDEEDHSNSANNYGFSVSGKIYVVTVEGN